MSAPSEPGPDRSTAASGSGGVNALSPESTPTDGPRRQRRAVTATAIGNLLEWYDFAIYASLASVLGPLFFPAASPAAGLLASLSVLAVGYVARPIGAVVFGQISDRRGRRTSLAIIIIMMGVATVGIGLLPTYAAIGIAAPILLVVARTLQGLSIGGEFSTASTYLVELAPPGRRGLYGSIIYATAALGFALGLGVIMLLNVIVTPQGVSDGWWRLAFILGAPLLLIGRYLRRRAVESPAFERSTAVLAGSDATGGTASATPVRSVRIRPLAQVFGISIAVSVAVATLLGFAASYLLVIVEVAPSTAYGSVLIATVLGAGLVLLGGHLSDRFGRRPMMVSTALGIAVLGFPSYLLMSSGGFLAALGGQLLLWIPAGLAIGVLPTQLAELFAARNRTTSMGVPFAIVTATFSGTAPLVSNLMITGTGSVIAPAWYLFTLGLISGAVALSLRETAWTALQET